MSRDVRGSRTWSWIGGRVLAILGGLALTSAVVGCGGSIPAGATVSPPGAPTATPTLAPGQSSSPGPTGPSSGSVTASPTCAGLPISGVLPGNRLVAVGVTRGGPSDRIALTFAVSPGPAPVGAARPLAVLEAAQPPFVHGGSGQPLVVAGDRFVRLTLRNMAIADDAGRPFYAGPAAFRPSGESIREVALAEAFEGVETWIVGLPAGAGCVALGRSADGMTVTIEVGGG